MLVKRKYDIFAIVVVVLCVVAYASFRSEYRLRSNMPAEFFDPSRISPAKRPAEERIAKAYWQSAVTQVQWKHSYAQRLPEDPPAEFFVTPEQGGSAARDPQIRARYWQRLREVWGVSAIWEEQYTWNVISLAQSMQSAGQWMEQEMRRIAKF